MSSFHPSETDHAIVAGIGRYQDPGLAALRGACGDARCFQEWLVHPEGGAVPERNVTVCLDATDEELNAAFVRLGTRAGEAGFLGRRLYIYLAGHGIAQNLDETSLLAADGGPGALDRHIPGWLYACWFRMAACFREVVLFADCCRTQQRELAVRPFPLSELRSPAAGRTLWVRAFAARYGQSATELQREGEARGVFTSALLEALARARDEQGRVTAGSIREYLLNHPRLARWQGRQDPSIVSEGEVVFSAAAPAFLSVRLRVAGDVAPVIQGGPGQRAWEVRPGAAPGEFVAELPRGIYAARAGGRTALFELTGAPEEARDVSI